MRITTDQGQEKQGEGDHDKPVRDFHDWFVCELAVRDDRGEHRPQAFPDRTHPRVIRLAL